MPEIPTQSQPTSNKKSINWKRILIVVVAVAVVIGLVVLVFLILQPKPETISTVTTKKAIPSATTATPSTQKDETTDWKTYSSTRDGYSIKYPPNWIVIPEKLSDGPYIRNFDFSSKPPEDPPKNNYPKGYINLRVLRLEPNVGKALASDLDPLDATEWYNKLGTPNQIDSIANASFDISTLENYKVNGMPAKRVKSVFTETNEIILIPHNNYVYEIILYPYGASTHDTVKLILSTFKFLD